MASFAACQLGNELALQLEPLPTLRLIRQAQQEATEAKAILATSRSVPFGGIQNVRHYVERALDGGGLRPDHLTALAIFV